MYESIYELPTQVRNSLDEVDQRVYLNVYNDQRPSSMDEIRRARRKAWRACKNLPSSFSFCIRATVEVIDVDKDIIDVPSVKMHMDNFIDAGGNIQGNHGSHNLGVIWDWEPIEVGGKPGIKVWGNVFGGTPVYDKARKEFIEGTNKLSVAGVSSKKKFQCDDRGCYVRRYVDQIMEISLCNNPANPMATLEWYNELARVEKSADNAPSVRLDVVEYEIHRDRDNCPIHQLKAELEKVGFKDMHVSPEGVVIPMTRADFYKCACDMHNHGLFATYLGGKVVVQETEKVFEKTFKQGHREGWLDDSGYVTSKITRPRFESLYDAGMLEHDEVGFRLGPLQ